MTRLFCWLGFHRFREGWAHFGDVVGCERCGRWFRLVRDGASDDPRFVKVRLPRG